MKRICAAITAAALFLAAASAHAQAPTAAEATKAMQAAEAVYLKAKAPLACGVVDMSGDIVIMKRRDSARPFTSRVAHGKARVTVAFGQPSSALVNFAGRGLDKAVGEPAFFFPGAVPLIKNGKQIGAIACAGGTEGSQDEDAAKAGAATLQ